MEWMPIETAPKNGERFLFTNGGFIGIGFFISGQWFACDSWRGETNSVPTHWMPLPAPPERP